MSEPSSWKQPIAIAVTVTITVTLLSYWAPPEAAGTLVGLLFFGATYVLVLRQDNQTIREYGLSLGGLFETRDGSPSRMVRSTLRALGYCALLSAIVFLPFWLGYRIWFDPPQPFRFRLPSEPFQELLAQVLAVALPEEMFYRGYLQSALDRVSPPRWKIAGAELGWGMLVASAIFALGHLATTPNPSRLAVFFPALLFGWLRARTGGIGAAVLFHAACNLFSAYLARGYGFLAH